MRKYDSRLAGILGAIIIHLIAAIIFMLLKLGSLNIKEYTKEYEIALQQPAEAQYQEIKPTGAPATVEQVVADDRELLNIARNLSKQPDVRIDRQDYIDMVKDEMIKDGKLGRDNYIDEWKNRKENSDVAVVNADKAADQKKKDDNSENSRELASKYSGPTRIYYNLEGRTHTYLPLPIYKCEGAGKVVLSIEVNPKGIVTAASVIQAESTTTDPCLVETAYKTAIISQFNADIRAPRSQTGTITYHFVAQ
jgi:hypothetical protein